MKHTFDFLGVTILLNRLNRHLSRGQALIYQNVD